MIKAENAKFAREFSSPHTSMYTGVHESIDQILDPKYVFMCDCLLVPLLVVVVCVIVCVCVCVCVCVFAVFMFPRRTCALPALCSSCPLLFSSRSLSQPPPSYPCSMLTLCYCCRYQPWGNTGPRKAYYQGY